MSCELKIYTSLFKQSAQKSTIKYELKSFAPFNTSKLSIKLII